MMKNITFEKFGGEDYVYYSNKHWNVLIRVKQVTLGSSVLICKRPITSLSELNQDELLSMGEAIKNMEYRLKLLFNYDKINYLLLMMQDNEVHFHVFPRYSKIVKYAENDWHDSEWPKPPDMSKFITDSNILEKLLRDLRV